MRDAGNDEAIAGRQHSRARSWTLRLWGTYAADGDFAVGKGNYVDHTVTDQTSVLRFIEDNWNLGKIGNGSFDVLANSITSMFDFTQTAPQNSAPVILSPTTGMVQ